MTENIYCSFFVCVKVRLCVCDPSSHVFIRKRDKSIFTYTYKKPNEPTCGENIANPAAWQTLECTDRNRWHTPSICVFIGSYPPRGRIGCGVEANVAEGFMMLSQLLGGKAALTVRMGFPLSAHPCTCHSSRSNPCHHASPKSDVQGES